MKEGNPHSFPILLFDELLTSHRHIISSFIFKSNLFHFIVIIRIFQNFAFSANRVGVFCDITVSPRPEKLQGKGNLCDKDGKILHGAMDIT
jgi:hypothetical protein